MFDKLDKVVTSKSRDERVVRDLQALNELQVLQERMQDMKQRSKFAYVAVGFAGVYLVAVIVIVVLCGCGNMSLSDLVLSILLGSTMSCVMGILAFVMKYLFNPKR